MSSSAELFARAWQHHQANDLPQAECLYRQILQADPGHADAWCFLGAVCQAQDRIAEAEQYFRRALELVPGYATAHNCLGIVLANQGRLEEAADCFERLVDLQPQDAEAWNNLGEVRRRQGRHQEALADYRQALRLNPAHAHAHSNLGNLFRSLGRLDEAAACCQEALRLKPDFAIAASNLGNAYLGKGQVDEAIACFRQALRLQPDFASAHSNLLLALNYTPHADPDEVFAEHRRWGERHGRVTPLPPPADRDRRPDRRLRIGYVSPDLRAHALFRYFEPVLAHHDPARVEVFCYAEVSDPDALTARFQRLAHGWRWTCGRTDQQVAEQVRADAIDILVDLAGHTANSRVRVFAYRPAPIQATWLGYPNTTGLDTIDYRLTDDLFDPPGQPIRDTEQLWRLPAGMCCFGSMEGAPEVGPLPALRTGRLTFGSLHALTKINAAVFDLWCHVLHALPSARLRMFRNTLIGETREAVHRQFTQRGIAAERLDLSQESALANYLNVYNEIDVALDVFPYTGGTTTCESLGMGVPVVSLAGQRPAARGSACLLGIAGLGDWVVETPDDYVARAVQAAADLEQLARLRAGMRERLRATLWNARRFTRGLEDAYGAMWRRWCAKP